MTSKLLTIPFSFQASPGGPAVTGLRKESIIADLLGAGYDSIDLIDLPGQYSDLCHATDHGVTLWVDHDAKYLAEGYLELETLVESGKPGKHYTFLNDGGLEITGLVSDQGVDLEINRYPGLNVALRSTFRAIVPVKVYLSTWRRLAAALASFQQ